jgi:hypothetical protein
MRKQTAATITRILGAVIDPHNAGFEQRVASLTLIGIVLSIILIPSAYDAIAVPPLQQPRCCWIGGHFTDP